MQAPRKHHYLPVFLLKRWIVNAAAPEVFAYSRPHKNLVVDSYPPTAIAYGIDLYSIPSRSTPFLRQAVERDFMSPLDNGAANALTFIETQREKPSDALLRDAWTRFLMSMMFRSPDRIKWISQLVNNRFADVEETYSRIRRPNDPEQWQDYRTSHNSALDDELRAKLLVTFCDNKTIGNLISGMFWYYAELKDLPFPLLLSDNPIMMSNGIGNESGFIIMPVGPNTIFLATNTVEVAECFRRQAAKAHSLAFNDAAVRQADRLVIGSTDRQFNFINKRLGFGGSSSQEGWFKRLTWRVP